MADWDLNAYKTKFESEEHWELKKAFMLAHKSRIPEDELVCLAQCFTNIEFMGCRYPPETMSLVAELSKDVVCVSKFRKSRENTIKRTFVQASDAAASKVQATFKRFKSNEERKPQLTPREAIFQNLIVMNQNIQQTQIEFERNNFGKFTESFSIDVKTQIWKGKALINNEVMAEAEGIGKKTVQKLLKKKLLEVLNEHCYKIAKKLQSVNLPTEEKVERKELPGKTKAFSPATSSIVSEGKAGGSFEENKLQSSNIGFKMLQKLGWGGGSLGSTNQGIVDPISCQIKIGRSGLGGCLEKEKGNKTNNKIDMNQRNYSIDLNYYKNIFRKFKESGIEYDLVFASEFTKEERALFHRLAQNLGLKTQSYGEEDNRQFVVKGKKLSPHELMAKIRKGDPIFSEMYEILAPGPIEN